MIPTPGNIETARDQYEREVKEALEVEKEDRPYFQYTWFGLTYSYTKEGYWGRMILVAVLITPVLLIVAANGYACLAIGILLEYVAVFGLAFLMLRRYRRSSRWD